MAETWVRDADLIGGTEIAFTVDCRDMAKPDWLSIEEISHLWSEETGLDASDFKKDLEEWFAEFVKQSPASQSLKTGKNTDTTNRLMGMLGARYLERSTFEAYCEERGHPKPRFWFGGRLEPSRRDDPSQSEPLEPPPEVTLPQPSAERSSEKEEGIPEMPSFQAHAAEVGEFNAELKPAEQQSTNLSALTEASGASSVVRASASGPASPRTPWYDVMTRFGPKQRHSARYRSPKASSQLLRETTVHWKSRGMVFLAAGLITLLAAVLPWGGIRKQAIKLTSSVEAANTDESNLRVALQRAEEQVAQADKARKSAEATAAEVRTALSSVEQEVVALSEQLESALGTTAGAGEAVRLRNDNTHLMDKLARTNAEAISLRTAVQEAEERAEARQQDLMLAATTASARAAALQRELEAAHQEIANLSKAVGSAEEEAIRLRKKLAAAEQEFGSSQPLMQPPPLNIMKAGLGQQPAIKASPPDDEWPSDAVMVTTRQMPAVPKTQATATSDIKSSRNSATVATVTPKADAVGEILKQVATYETTEVPRGTDVNRDTVSPNDLVYEPHKYQGRHVVVTGSMVWLLWRYRLKSEIGQNSIVIDVDGLRRADQAKLKAAIENAGFLGQVRAHIKGKIERQTVATFRLAVSELVLIE